MELFLDPKVEAVLLHSAEQLLAFDRRPPGFKVVSVADHNKVTGFSGVDVSLQVFKEHLPPSLFQRQDSDDLLLELNHFMQLKLIGVGFKEVDHFIGTEEGFIVDWHIVVSESHDLLRDVSFEVSVHVTKGMESEVRPVEIGES